MVIIGIILLPFIYTTFLLWCRMDFKNPQNQSGKPLCSLTEIAVVAVSEAAVLRVWYMGGMEGFHDLQFTLLYVMLAGLTVFCVTDLRQRGVPNKVLLVLLLLFVLILGLYSLTDMNAVAKKLPAIVSGMLFTAICFGLGYLLSRKNMGAGDVKLALVMGLYLTGEYVVGAVLYGCLAGAAYAILQLMRKKLSKNDAIPFVPFLYMGTVIRYWMG